MSSGIVISLQTWCIQKGGPVFVAIFQPVQTVLVALMAYVILGDQFYTGGYVKDFAKRKTKCNFCIPICISRFYKLLLYLQILYFFRLLCRIVGAALIVVGLYLVLWGKTEEKKQENKDANETLTKHLLDDSNKSKNPVAQSDIP